MTHSILIYYRYNLSLADALRRADELGGARTGVPPVATRPLFRLDTGGEAQTSAPVPVNAALDSSVTPTSDVAPSPDETAPATSDTSASVPVDDPLDSGRPHEYPHCLATVPDGPCTPHNHPPSGA